MVYLEHRAHTLMSYFRGIRHILDDETLAQSLDDMGGYFR